MSQFINHQRFYEKDSIIIMTPDTDKRLKSVEIIAFDMDGVITSESMYWVAAGLTALEIAKHSGYCGNGADDGLFYQSVEALCRHCEPFLTPRFIATVKNHSINTNWDLAYLTVALHLIERLKGLRDSRLLGLVELDGLTVQTLQLIGKSLNHGESDRYQIDELAATFFNRYPYIKGFDYLEALNRELIQSTAIKSGLFNRTGGFWALCIDLFQEWFLGAELFEKTYQKTAPTFKLRGLIHDETPVIPIEKIAAMLAYLKSKGYVLAIATGRPFDEITLPLRAWNLLDFFDDKRVATYREVEQAESRLTVRNTPQCLSKPHPYLFLRAIYPEKNDLALVDAPLPIADKERVLVVTDSVSDVMIAQRLGCLCVAVLTGLTSEKGKKGLLESQPDFIVNDVALLRQLIEQGCN
jgi:phosphoglycolate phosphatase-like HAD superfamily hydrolase